MVSEFRKKKYLFLFKFYDEDNNKFIEKKDFELSVQFISKRRGWQPGDAKYKSAEERLLKIWDSLQKHADKDNDGKISVDEWVSMWDEYAKNPSGLEWQNLYCKFIFDVNDATSDGAIDLDEYTSVMESFGTEKNAAATYFQKMAKGKSTISWEDFQELWKDFMSSDDPNTPGNYVFGTTDF